MNRDKIALFKRVDWFTILVYLLLLVSGWFAICGASYNFDSIQFFEIGGRPFMQLVWMGLGLVLILTILLLDVGWFEIFAPLIYYGVMFLLLVTIFVSPNIKGSHSWLVIGPLRVQPAEFAKIATALMLARTLNTHGFVLKGFRNYAKVFGLILLPMVLILAEKETGSALVFTALFLALYREGLSGLFLGLALLAVILFIATLSFGETIWGDTQASICLWSWITSAALLFSLSLKPKKNKTFFYCCLGLGFFAYLVAFILSIYFPIDYSYFALFQLAILLLYILVEWIKSFAKHYLLVFLLGIGCVLYSLSVTFVFNKVLQPHQQVRIAVLLGLKEDPKGVEYNVNQAKIAIGSGGLMGKGFLKGMQTKLGYVPEHDTDFIFCTVGEEFGFLGASALLLLYLILILRIYYLAERQDDLFGRVYAYCVASIFTFHLAINIGMVLGVLPVIGIPLPFFSYGGSSLWGFSILLFILIRIDSEREKSTFR